MPGTNIRDFIPLPYDYFLRKMVFGEYSELEISKDDFRKIKVNLDALFASRSIEEKYDVMLENYVQFEQDIAAICIESIR